MNLMDKIDRMLLKFFSYFTLRWIKKHKYEKHKFDFCLQMILYEMGFYAVFAILGPIWSLRFHTLRGWAIFPIALFDLFIEYMTYKKVMIKKESYDWLFMNRKNPVIYQGVKSGMEELSKMFRNMRLAILALLVSLMIVNIAVNIINPGIPIVIVYVLGTIYRIYVDDIFDFDEPDEPRQVKKDVTEITQQAFQRLADSVRLGPSPV